MNPNTFLEGSDLYLSDPIVKSLKKKKKKLVKNCGILPQIFENPVILKKVIKKKNYRPKSLKF